jgi:hypothetical protein
MVDVLAELVDGCGGVGCVVEVLAKLPELWNCRLSYKSIGRADRTFGMKRVRGSLEEK